MTAPAQVLAAVRPIPHPRQESDLTALHPSPAVPADTNGSGGPDDLDRYIAEQQQDPEFREALATAQARPAEPPGELREAILKLIRDDSEMGYSESTSDELTDALLSGPLAPLLAKLRAAEAREAIARIEGCAGALNAAVHEVDDDEDAQLLARRAIQWEQEADALRRALDGS